MTSFNSGLKELENILKKKTDDVVFFEITESTKSPFEDLMWTENMAIPIMTTSMIDKVVHGTQADINVSTILEGMVHILGIDPEFVHRDFYIKFLRRADTLFYRRICSNALYLFDEDKLLDSLIRFRAALLFVEDMPQSRIIDILYNCGKLCEQLASKDHVDENKQIYENASVIYFNEVLKLDENHGFASYHLGFYHINKREFYKAKQHWIKALETQKIAGEQRLYIVKQLRKIEDEIMYEKGYKAIIEGFNDEGLSYLLPLVEEYPEWWNLHFFVGLAYRKKEMFAEAIQSFKKVLNLNTGHIDSMNEIAICYISAGDNDNAQKYLVEANRLNPNNHEILCNLGILELQMGNHKKALDNIERALSIKPDDDIVLAWYDALKHQYI